MNTAGRIRACSAAAAAALLFVVAIRARSLDASLNEKSRLSLLGDTNHGTWQCATSAMTATIKSDLDRAAFDRAIALLDARGNGQPVTGLPDGETPHPPTLQLRIPVAALDCGIRQMERDLRRALRADQFPDITFDLQRIDSLTVLQAGQYTFTVSGILRLAGAAQEVKLRLAATRLPGGRYRFVADLPLRMTQFGVTPPVGFFGLIHVSDELQIRFDLVFSVTG